MNMKPNGRMKLSFHPLSKERWKDFEALFGENGACGGCWCMYWRQTQKEFNALRGVKNKRLIKKIITSGNVPGILAYHEGKAVGWCAVEPREAYSRLSRSRVLSPVDDKPVWSVTCFYVDKRYRKMGVTVQLLREAVKHVRKKGGKVIEGYPVDPEKGKIPDVFAYTGLASAFRKAGFKETARRSASRPIFRAGSG